MRYFPPMVTYYDNNATELIVSSIVFEYYYIIFMAVPKSTKSMYILHCRGGVRVELFL